MKHCERYRNRVVVEYDSNTIKVGHLDETGVAKRLRSATVITLLIPEDPARKDMFTGRDATLDGKLFIQREVIDQEQQRLRTRADLKQYAQYLTTRNLQRLTIVVENASAGRALVEFDMIGAAERRAAQAKFPSAPERSPGAPLAARERTAKAAPDKAPSAKTPDPQDCLRTDPNFCKTQRQDRLEVPASGGPLLADCLGASGPGARRDLPGEPFQALGRFAIRGVRVDAPDAR